MLQTQTCGAAVRSIVGSPCYFTFFKHFRQFFLNDYFVIHIVQNLNPVFSPMSLKPDGEGGCHFWMNLNLIHVGIGAVHIPTLPCFPAQKHKQYCVGSCWKPSDQHAGHWHLGGPSSTRDNNAFLLLLLYQPSCI